MSLLDSWVPFAASRAGGSLQGVSCRVFPLLSAWTPSFNCLPGSQALVSKPSLSQTPPFCCLSIELPAPDTWVQNPLPCSHFLASSWSVAPGHLGSIPFPTPPSSWEREQFHLGLSPSLVTWTPGISTFSPPEVGLFSLASFWDGGDSGSRVVRFLPPPPKKYSVLLFSGVLVEGGAWMPGFILD